jgi:hypothetical protein
MRLVVPIVIVQGHLATAKADEIEGLVPHGAPDVGADFSVRRAPDLSRPHGDHQPLEGRRSQIRSIGRAKPLELAAQPTVGEGLE